MEQVLLIVDDEINILKALKHLLQNEGYQIYTCSSGVEALEILAKTPVQVIISDQVMPGMRGSELLTKVKKLYPNVIRIILSAYADFDAIKEALNEGAIYKFLSKPWNNDALLKVIKEAFQITSEQSEQEKKLSWLLEHDTITGLPNFYLFNRTFLKMLDDSRLVKRSFALIIFDFDRFNQAHEHLGPSGNDEALKIIASNLLSLVKNENQLSRLGDKFYLLLEYKSMTALKSLLNKFMDKMSQPVSISDQALFLNVNIGLSIFPDHGESYDDLINHARVACAESKELGANNWQIYKESSLNRKKDLIAEIDIYKALEQKEFVLYYQPMVEATTCKIKGVEALIRWQHPTLGLLAPDAFIQICERNGLIVPIGNWVLQTACEQLKQWQDNGHDLFVAINISPRQLQFSSLLDLIPQVLESTQISPTRLKLEITESIMMKDLSVNMELLQKLADLSVSISIDDFGTGYSSLSYLKNLPIHELKIDKSLIDDLVVNQTTQHLLKNIVVLAKIYKLEVVAEGVETIEQFSILKEHHCDLIQGYLFSKPVPAKEIEQLLKDGFKVSV